MLHCKKLLLSKNTLISKLLEELYTYTTMKMSERTTQSSILIVIPYFEIWILPPPFASQELGS